MILQSQSAKGKTLKPPLKPAFSSVSCARLLRCLLPFFGLDQKDIRNEPETDDPV